MPSAHAADWQLVRTDGRLVLRDVTNGRSRPVYVDFDRAARTYAGRARPRRTQGIARAVGLRKQAGIRLIDATAGLGSDTFLLAWLGCQVLAVERNAVLHALLQDGLRRARKSTDKRLVRVVDRIKLAHADSRRILESLAPADYPDTIYLDPMFPYRTKKALMKKELRVCRSLVGGDTDSTDLLEIARSVAKRRVVVKRQPGAPPIQPVPDYAYKGNTARYDVYTSRHSPDRVDRLRGRP